MLFYLLTFLLPTTAVDYAAHYGTAYQEAVQWVEKQAPQLHSQVASYGLTSQEVIPIVFPELLRYAAWRDLLETEALGLAYVEGGSAWADFSIGVFQMKPSFAEALENCLQHWEAGQANFQHLLPNTSHSITQQRQARLDRLTSLEGQIAYVCCFYAWMHQRIGFQLVTSTTSQKIALLATAYNSGFWKSWPVLSQASQQHFFPYGANYPQEGQHAYQAVALAYYQQLPPPPWTAYYWPFWSI